MGSMILVTNDDFSVDEVLRKIRNKRTGAIVSFVGVVREDDSGRKIKMLEMETYKGMAEKELSDLKDKAMEKYDLEEVTIIHRIGSLSPGDNIVLIAVASGHRKEAFAGAEFLIDELKKVVPLWKKEILEDGEVWVEGGH
ncbi:MAG: molybdenum cofactor biosynthesis protein MoaE [Methanomassiliicoccales archaeon]|nr:molybdenum cofactor biosynthesis protein MoaE [Methanomassiliicoccales archaeon]